MQYVSWLCQDKEIFLSVFLIYCTHSLPSPCLASPLETLPAAEATAEPKVISRNFISHNCDGERMSQVEDKLLKKNNG